LPTSGCWPPCCPARSWPSARTTRPTPARWAASPPRSRSSSSSPRPPSRVPSTPSSAHQAGAYVFGYTCANDVTARDLQATDGQWARAKGFDTFCPLGPWIETQLDPSDLEIRTTVNGEVKQESRTSLLLHAVPALVSYAAAVMTLLPGDVLLTGTPEGVGPLDHGDQVSVTIEGIGTLTNRVADSA
jgi:2-keto-4-pentenoate hydratase/2-oxohepta-3-ene-1,7-dioic acid hydratase in catechol pathway